MIFRRIKSLKDIKAAEKQFQEDIEQVELEKNDKAAMIIAAFLVFVPATLIVVALLVLIPMLFFRLF